MALPGVHEICEFLLFDEEVERFRSVIFFAEEIDEGAWE